MRHLGNRDEGRSLVGFTLPGGLSAALPTCSPPPTLGIRPLIWLHSRTMACGCGKKKQAALAQRRGFTASAEQQKPPLVPTRPATWNGKDEKK